MKTLLRKHKYLLLVLGVVGCAIIISCQTSRAAKVEFGPQNVVMHPGVKLTPEDEIAMNKVLKRYDKRLYRFETLENGQVKKAWGTASVEGPVKVELATAKAGGGHGSGIGTACPNTGCTSKQITSHDLRIVDDLKKVLKDYQ